MVQDTEIRALLGWNGGEGTPSMGWKVQCHAGWQDGVYTLEHVSSGETCACTLHLELNVEKPSCTAVKWSYLDGRLIAEGDRLDGLRIQIDDQVFALTDDACSYVYCTLNVNLHERPELWQALTQAKKIHLLCLDKPEIPVDCEPLQSALQLVWQLTHEPSLPSNLA